MGSLASLARGRRVNKAIKVVNLPPKALSSKTRVANSKKPVVQPGAELIAHSAVDDLIECSRFYITCLCNVALELGFVYLLLKLHRLYELHAIDPLPDGKTKAVSVALGLLFEIFNLALVVKFGVIYFWSSAGKIK
jgi:hypothetical protein